MLRLPLRYQPMATALRADAARNRTLLLEAAERLFGERGLDVSVDDIAHEAGVGVGTLYRRFPTRDDLLAAVLDDCFASVIERLDAARAEPDPWTALERATAAYAEEAVVHRALLHRFAYAGCHASLIGAAKTRMLQRLDEVLERARGAGVVRDDIVPLDLLALGGMLSKLPPYRLEREPDIWRRWLGLMLDGLRPEGAHPLPHPPPRDLRPHGR
jgi:AcrR family transcriptional regulator